MGVLLGPATTDSSRSVALLALGGEELGSATTDSCRSVALLALGDGAGSVEPPDSEVACGGVEGTLSDMVKFTFSWVEVGEACPEEASGG
jgi:hypothetical protein